MPLSSYTLSIINYSFIILRENHDLILHLKNCSGHDMVKITELTFLVGTAKCMSKF